MQQNRYPTTFPKLTVAGICWCGLYALGCVFMCAFIKHMFAHAFRLGLNLSTLLHVDLICVFFSLSVCMCVQVSCLSWYRIRPLSSASVLDTTLLTSLFATRAAHSQKSPTSTDGPLRDRKIRPPKCFIGLMPFLIDFLSSVPLSSLVHVPLFSLSHGLIQSQRHISH